MQSNNASIRLAAVVSPRDTYTYLDRALQLLRAPRYDKHQQQINSHSWIQNTLAIDASNNHVDPKSDLAVAYCTLGAVQAVTPTSEAAVYVNSIIDMANPNVISATYSQEGGIPVVNDQSQFSSVERMFMKAMRLVEKWIN